MLDKVVWGDYVTPLGPNNWNGVSNNPALTKLFDDGSGSTVTLKGGDRYPAQRADLGDRDVTVAASDVVYICVETSRYMKNDGTMIVISSDAGLILTAFSVPRVG